MLTEAFIESCFESVPCLWDPNREQPPLFVAFSMDSGPVCLHPSMVQDLSDEHEKAKAQFADWVVGYCRQHSVVALLVTTEAVVRPLKPGADLRRAQREKGYRRANSGKPEESLFASLELRDGRMEACRWPILREGNQRRLGPRENLGAGMVGGMFGNLLRKRNGADELVAASVPLDEELHPEPLERLRQRLPAAASATMDGITDPRANLFDFEDRFRLFICRFDAQSIAAVGINYDPLAGILASEMPAQTAKHLSLLCGRSLEPGDACEIDTHYERAAVAGLLLPAHLVL